MNMRKTGATFGAQSTLMVAAAVLMCGAVRADVTWEHTVVVRVAGQQKPVFNLKMFNSWSGSKKRTLIKFAPSSLPGGLPDSLPGHPPWGDAFQPTNSGAKKSGIIEVAYIQDLEGDRMMAYSTQAREYFDEPLRPTLKRLRFDPWKKLAPRLSQEAPPEFTPQQRARLGAEVRALYTPYLKQGMKLYFRNLPNIRTFEGVEARGYRLSTLLNAGGSRNPQWVRTNFEWWLANDLEGDEEVRNYQKGTRQLIRDIGGPSASMWLNELYPVIWQMFPQELHQAMATFLPPAGSPRESFGGTPVRLFMTVVPPALQRAAMGGEARAEVALVSRSNGTLREGVFTAPTGFKKIEAEPHIKQMETLMKGDFPNMPPMLQPFLPMNVLSSSLMPLPR
jgi:hypothetical protein